MSRKKHFLAIAFFGLAFGIILVLSIIHATAVASSPCSLLPMRVEGGSMSPRIAPGQLIQILQGQPSCLGTLKHGDVVLFHSDSSRVPLIKALRGLPGDKFAVSDGKIIINDSTATNSAGQPYQLSPPRAAMIDLYVHDDHGVIPPDSFLVMGENPAGSIDSSRFGLVGRQAIMGKLVETAATPP